MFDLTTGRLLIVGNPEPVHVGAHFWSAACKRGLKVEFCDVRAAYRGSRLRQKWNWWFCDRRPLRQRQFSKQLLDVCRRFQPTHLLVTGLAPVEKSVLVEIGRQGAVRINFLTDDPWNPALGTRWFRATLPVYDRVFSPRRANLSDLQALGCSQVAYVPFAYAPEIHFSEPAAPEQEEALDSDMVFVGGADADRVPYFASLIQSGIKVRLYGGYWVRYPPTRHSSCGMADPPTMRRAIAGARVALCLVRRGNRDGHSMRTFELGAIGVCVLAEDTDEHREIFGADGESVVYFHTIPQMHDRLRHLLENPDERKRLATAVHDRIVGGANTYGDRLAQMLELPDSATC
jgi:hypothetical protein